MSIPTGPRWLPLGMAVLLVVGALLTSSIRTQEGRSLRLPLMNAVPEQVGALRGRDVEVPEIERQVAGMSEYVMRIYEPEAVEGQPAAPGSWASVYVGYYESQTRGKTIHSPKNCMPGAGWEPMDSRTVAIPVAGSAAVEVNRYLLVNETQKVLVLYWYQGRGRVVADEFQAKWELLRDAAVIRRTDEALVRIVVPVVDGDEERAFAVALELAQDIMPDLTDVLPAA